MQKNKVDWAVVLGEFQPLTEKSLQLVEQARNCAERVAIIISTKCVSVSSPLSEEFIQNSLSLAADDLYIGSMEESLYDRTQSVVSLRQSLDEAAGWFCLERSLATAATFADSEELGLLLDAVIPGSEAVVLEGPLLQNFYVDSFDPSFALPERLAELTRQYQSSMEFTSLKEQFIRAQKEFSGPPPVRIVTPAVVVHNSGMILLTESDMFGAEKITLPFHALQPKQTLFQSTVCALRSHAGLKIAMSNFVLKSSRVFDHPRRGTGSRCLAQASLFLLDGPVPAAAAHSFWAPVEDLVCYQNRMHGDHYAIACEMLKAA